MTVELFISVFSLFVNLTKEIDPEGLGAQKWPFFHCVTKKRLITIDAIDAKSSSPRDHYIHIYRVVCLNRFILSFFMMF